MRDRAHYGTCVVSRGRSVSPHPGADIKTCRCSEPALLEWAGPLPNLYICPEHSSPGKQNACQQPGCHSQKLTLGSGISLALSFSFTLPLSLSPSFAHSLPLLPSLSLICSPSLLLSVSQHSHFNKSPDIACPPCRHLPPNCSANSPWTPSPRSTTLRG